MRRTAYPTVHTFNSFHPSVVILQMRRTAYPTLLTFNSHHPTVAILQMLHCTQSVVGFSPLSHILATSGLSLEP